MSSQRRSKRRRRERYIQVDGFNILRLNNYNLEDGETSVYVDEAKKWSAVKVEAEKPKTPYQLFVKEFCSKHGTTGSASKLLVGAASAWSELPDSKKAAFEKKSKKLKDKYEKAKLEAQREAVKRRKAAEAVELRVLKDKNRVAEEEALRWKKRKADSTKMKAEKKPRQFSREEKRRLDHNMRMAARRVEALKKRKRFMALHKRVISPFINQKVYESLPNISKDEIEKMNSVAPDVEAEAKVKQPESIVYGTMRGYQLNGLEWMLYMFENGTSMILGDEMGLGKTLQTISFLAGLKERGINGPHLITVPLSVLSSWRNEFRRWCPSFKVIRLHSADKNERERLRKLIVNDLGSYDVVLTTYEFIKSPEMKVTISSRVNWTVVVLDEGHRVKNHETSISIAMKKIKSEVVLLLTGTPLQNNLRELWGLLTYLHPSIFTDVTPFESAFELNGAESQINKAMLEKAHYMLRPLMLRRLKKEVEKLLPPRVETKVLCPLSEVQQFWYKRLLLKNKQILMRAAIENKEEEEDSSQDWKKLKSLMMQLRKCCNHPFLFPGAEKSIRGNDMSSACDESIVEASGKMTNLDLLLPKLKEKGHRVVIFSQFTTTLDLVDDYLNMRGYEFARLDGSTNRVQRMVDIQEFNKKNSPYFAFIMTTRAGGLGVNLQTADTVILLDSDWNPQVDMQAMARCHRIGQKKIVHVYRFISAGTMEERIVQRAQRKLYLDSMVNRGSTSQGRKMDKLGTKELLEALMFGVDRVFDKSGERQETQHYLTEKDIADLIERVDPRSVKAKKTKSQSLKCNQKKSAFEFKAEARMVSMQTFQGEDYSKYKNATMDDIALEWAHLAKKGSVRKRSSRFINVDGFSILKQNMYKLNEGEPSVLEREAKGKMDSIGGPIATSGRQVAGRDYDHMSVCLSCWDGGEIICCDICPAAYHCACLGIKDVSVLKGSVWACPGHQCVECGRKASAVGGMLFRCEMCPMSYCEDHLPDFARNNITNKCKRYMNLGQNHPKQACFVLCSVECKFYYEASDEGQDVNKACAIMQKFRDSGVKSLEQMQLEIETDEKSNSAKSDLYKLTSFERLAVSCASKGNSLQERFSYIVESKKTPLSLGDIDGFRLRCKKVHAASMNALCNLLLNKDYNSDTLDKLCEYSGVLTAYPSAKPPSTNSDKESEAWKTSIAETYLQLVRTLQGGSKAGFSRHVLKDFFNILDLKQDLGGKLRSVNSIPYKVMPEILACFLAFPCPGYLQIFPRYFTEEKEEEEDVEADMEVKYSQKPLQSKDDIKEALLEELEAQEISKSTVCYELEVRPICFHRWFRADDDTELEKDSMVAGELVVAWLMNERRKDWKEAVNYWKTKAGKDNNFPLPQTGFDSELLKGKLVSIIDNSLRYDQDPEIKVILSILDGHMRNGRTTESDAKLHKKLEDWGFGLGKLSGGSKVDYYIAPMALAGGRKKILDTQKDVMNWLRRNSMPMDEAGRRKLRMMHDQRLHSLVSKHNEQLNRVKQNIVTMKQYLNKRNKLLKEDLLEKGWMKRLCFTVEGQSRVVLEEAKNLVEKRKMFPMLTSPMYTLVFEPDECQKAIESHKIVKTVRRDISRAYKRKIKEKERMERIKAEKKLKKEIEAENRKAIEQRLFRTLIELKKHGTEFGSNFYQRGQFAGKAVLTFKGGYARSSKTDDFKAVAFAMEESKSLEKNRIDGEIQRLASTKSYFIREIGECSNSDIKISGLETLNLIFEGEIYTINPLVPFHIGRKADVNSLVLKHTNVSRKHCCINRGFLHDLDSKGGVFVNGVKKEIYRLQHGDVISVSIFKFTVKRTSENLAKDEMRKKAKMERKANMENKLKALHEREKLLEEKRKKYEQKWGIDLTIPNKKEKLCEILGIKKLDWKLENGRVIATDKKDDEEDDE